ncbi:MAG: sugar transferase [Clostridia bacterium]|nr:sugar transferase [Clostridia bacterium]
MPAKTRKSKMGHIDFLVIDLISVAASFILSYFIKFGNLDFVKSDAWMPLFYIALLLNIAICTFSDPYSKIFKRPYYEEIIGALLLSGYNLLASGIIFYVFKIGTLFSRQMILTMYGLYFLISVILKCIWKKLVLSKKISFYIPERISLLIVGKSETIDDSIRAAEGGDFNAYDVKAVSLEDTTDDFNSLKNIGKDKLIEYISENSIDEVLITVNPGDIDIKTYDALIKSGVGINFNLSFMLGFGAEDYELSEVGAHKTLNVGTYTFSPGQAAYLLLKRLIDIAISIPGLVFLFISALTVKAAYLISGDKSKIIYKQSRIGKNGKHIDIYKFRTMVPDADKKLAKLLEDEKYRTEWLANQKLSNDPRITKVGRFLRKTSIDEMPQLINVLKGDMSLVGPRPLVSGELEAHNGLKLYQQVKPGITGWWGCNGRSNIDYAERLELEYYYVRNISVYLDFLCILRTVLSVLKRDGAE